MKLPKRKSPGGPRSLVGGKRMTLYLDRATVEAAASIGKGNISAGLREAVKQARGKA